MSVDRVVERASAPTQVRRRGAATFGADGRATSGSVTTATVSLAIQPGSGEPTRLDRRIDGDQTVGEIRVWVSDRRLSEAFETGDVTETPLGWTDLQIAPPEHADGPPADRVVWGDREWEIVERVNHSEVGFKRKGRFKRYIARERGAP